MQSIWKSKGKKLHTRHIEVMAYNYDEQRIIVEGFLKDDRFQETPLITGELLPSGVVHHLSIRLLVNCSNLVIEDIDVDLIYVPKEACQGTIGSLAPIKGLTITRGFTSKVKKIAGGKDGCTHLMELLLAMAPAAFQGISAYESQKPSCLSPERTKKVLKLLVNTCRAWREDDPLVEKLIKKIRNT